MITNPIEVLYFGCLREAGHYLHSKPYRRLNYEGTPWGVWLDTGLLPKGEQYDGQVFSAKKDGWTAIAFWDRSVDTRPGSNSAFLVQADIPTDELMRLAREQWPEVFSRPYFPLTP